MQPVNCCLSISTIPNCFLQRLRVPLFFPPFRCNKPSSLFSSIVCISLYFIHVLF
uniref:Uncharacterized protein n=1 Tax=Terrapene triunguis TaxID=2587831 RepID=A0A674KGK6_9SAUR